MSDPSPYRQGETEVPIDLKGYGTPFEAIKTARQFIQFAVDPSKGLTRRRYGWHSNNSLFDSTLLTSDDNDGTISLDTRADQKNDTTRIRSAIVGQYVSQTIAQPGMGVAIHPENCHVDENGEASISHGKLAIGCGWHDATSGGWGVGGPVQTFLGLLFQSDGVYAVMISGGSHVGGSPVHQSEWNVDRLDGSGDTDVNPSGATLDPARGYIYNFPYGWYGYLPLFVGIIDPDTHRALMGHKFDFPGATFDRPNVAPMVISDNDGTARSLSVNVGGLQYTLYGANLSEEGGETRGLEVTRIGLTVTTQVSSTNNAVNPISEPGDPIISFKRQDGLRDLALKQGETLITPNNDIWLFSWDEYEPTAALTDENFREPNEVAASTETGVEVDTEATDYTPQTAVMRGMDFVETDKNQESLVAIETDDRIPIDATRIISAVHTGTDADLAPAKIRVIEGF